MNRHTHRLKLNERTKERRESHLPSDLSYYEIYRNVSACRSLSLLFLLFCCSSPNQLSFAMLQAQTRVFLSLHRQNRSYLDTFIRVYRVLSVSTSLSICLPPLHFPVSSVSHSLTSLRPSASLACIEVVDTPILPSQES